MVAGFTLLLGAITLGGTMHATAGDQPRPTSTPDAPGIVLASSTRLDLPQPFLLSASGKDYLYLSTPSTNPDHVNVPVLSGTPGNFGPMSDAMPTVPDWSLPASDGAWFWAPYVVKLGHGYVMYFSAAIAFSVATNKPIHCIGEAVSGSPLGPFAPVGRGPLVCQVSLGGDIDPQLFSDPQGPRGPDHPNYLVWKSDNNNNPGSGPTTIWAAPMSDDGLALAGKPVAIFVRDRAWEAPVLEAPQLRKAPDGSDWLFFSGGGGYYSPHYAIGAAPCAGPLGGCHDTAEAPLIASNAQGSGPGEETVFVAGDDSTWVLYNPWHAGEPSAPLRPVEAARIGWGADGPYVAEAGHFPNPS